MNNNIHVQSPDMKIPAYPDVSAQNVSNYQIPYRRIQSPQQSTTNVASLKGSHSRLIKASTVSIDNLGTGNIPKPKLASVLPKAKSP
jgi:hypothetical protein